jgi:hypothetical protein
MQIKLQKLMKRAKLPLPNMRSPLCVHPKTLELPPKVINYEKPFSALHKTSLKSFFFRSPLGAKPRQEPGDINRFSSRLCYFSANAKSNLFKDGLHDSYPGEKQNFVFELLIWESA